MTDRPLSLWTADEIAHATTGVVRGTFVATGVSIDTRTLLPGDLFIALSGARDGHTFAAQAMAKGACGILAARPVDAPHVIVSDVFLGLEALARAARERARAVVCAAVTGSVGKTSVTQAIGACLAAAGHGHASVKSYNNHIGVPLTLARMPRDTLRGVFEIGMNHAGEITPLSRMVRPKVAVVTTVGPVHIENFPDGEAGVAKAKAEIFDGLEAGGLAVLNADNAWFDVLAAAARSKGADIARFGMSAASDARLIRLEPDGEGQVATAQVYGRAVTIRLAQSGAHWGLNALMVLLATEALGVEREAALEVLAHLGPLTGRGATRALSAIDGPFTLVDESYNANPVSMAAVIAALGARPVVGRRILALTDMLELGGEGPQRHADLAAVIEAAKVDLVYCAGPLMQALWDVLPHSRRGGYATDVDTLARQLKSTVRAGDMVVVKGSNGSRASRIVDVLVGLEAQ